MEVDGRPLIDYQIDSLNRVAGVDHFVLATSRSAEDDPIASFCRGKGIPTFRGRQEDVLDRVYQAARAADADIVIRSCADCPLIDSELVQAVLDYYLAHRSSLDYASNIIERSYPRGLDCEVFSMAALERCWKEAMLPRERRHVTLHIYEHPESFRCANVAQEEDQSFYRWTVDEPDDFVFVSNVIKDLNRRREEVHLSSVLAVLAEHPSWISINAHVKQKQV
jgi:spore coat polysaccharide biosynthesis protein SpsF